MPISRRGSNPNLFYSFELTAPENRVIVPYAERRLTWLAAWDRDTLEEQEIETLPDLPTPRVREYPLQTLDEVMEAVDAITPFAGKASSCATPPTAGSRSRARLT